jgi:DNA invertase Pin-like site-specific DNA recombinase
MHVALYVRVSTNDKGQTKENQLRELRAFAERLGYTIYRKFGDQQSEGSASCLGCDSINTAQPICTVKRPFK